MATQIETPFSKHCMIAQWFIENNSDRRDGEPFSREDDEALISCYENKGDPSSLADSLRRTVTSVQRRSSRLRKSGQIKTPTDKMLSSQNIEKLERELQGRTFSISDVHAIAPNVSRAYAKDRVRKWYDKSMVERVRKGVYRFR